VKWVVDVELDITLQKELVVDAENADDARDQARDWAEDVGCTIGNGHDEWDEAEGCGGYTTYPAARQNGATSTRSPASAAATTVIRRTLTRCATVMPGSAVLA
jgi:hypothetical protein